MNSIQTTLKKSFIAFMVVVQVFGYSATGLVQIAAAEETPPAPTCPAFSGTTAPTGAGSHTFTFTPAPTCLWENTYYSWDPVTKIYTPKYDTEQCNAEDFCYKISWQYLSADGKYVETRTLVSSPAPTASMTSELPSFDNTTSDSGSSKDDGTTAQSSGSSIVSGNGTDSDNSITDNSTLNGDIDLNNDVSILTTLNSDATSGDAAALFNTTVGDVSTGDAATIANILNMIQSSWDPANGDLNVFSADLFNNYFGDLLFDPSIALGNGSGSTNNITDNSNTDLTINIEEDASIENDINLNAQSGNATANGNTDVGDVSTGDATAIANVINMINSMITSGNSFIGSINLHGDLNGDILLPQSLMEILLGNGTNSSNTIIDNQTTNVDANLNTNSSITNNTNLTANSGDAEANANTTVGDISTGEASTSVNEMNLVGQNIQGTKGLLVFVNVLGSWIGMLFGSPTTASIAGGNGTNSTNTITDNSTTNANIDVNRNYDIVNNLNLNASSGNATANANTTVGNVSTGNATSSVNLLNMIDSSMNFTDWFGVLFINVFGSWTGSFGVNTEAGNPSSAGGMGSGGATNSGAAETPAVAGASTTSAVPPEVFRFVPKAAQMFGSGGSSGSSVSASNETVAAVTTPQTSSTQTATEQDESPEAAASATNGGNVWLPIVFGLFAVALIFGERIVALIRRP